MVWLVALALLARLSASNVDAPTNSAASVSENDAAPNVSTDAASMADEGAATTPDMCVDECATTTPDMGLGESAEDDESLLVSAGDLLKKMKTLQGLLGETDNFSPELQEQMKELNTELKKLGLDLFDNKDTKDAEKLATKCWSMTCKHFASQMSTKSHIIAFSQAATEGLSLPSELLTNPVFRASATCFVDITTEELKQYDHKLVTSLPARLQESMHGTEMTDKINSMDMVYVKLLQDLATERRYEYEDVDDQKQLNPNLGVNGTFLSIIYVLFFSAVVFLTKQFCEMLQAPKSKAKLKKKH